jgi:hypothetical protein
MKKLPICIVENIPIQDIIVYLYMFRYTQFFLYGYIYARTYMRLKNTTCYPSMPCIVIRVKTSLYTMFRVLVLQLPESSSIRIKRPFCDVTLDIATYSCPCVKTGFFRYTPTFESVCPWLLLIVIA